MSALVLGCFRSRCARYTANSESAASCACWGSIKASMTCRSKTGARGHVGRGSFRAALARLGAEVTVGQIQNSLDVAYIEGLPLEEVAAQCDCSLATAKRRIADAHRLVSLQVSMGEVET